MTSSEIAPPPITERLRAFARKNPGTWAYEIDPEIDPAGRVPPTAIAGAWKVDDDGEIAGDFVPNEGYRPSPTALGWPTARSRLERAIQRVRCGLSDPSLVTQSLEEGELLVSADSAGAPIAVRLEDGRRQITVYSSRASARERSLVVVPGSELTRLFPPSVRVSIDPAQRSAWTVDI